MGDWNKPALSDTYSNFLTYLKNLAIDAGTAFVNSPTNQPTGSLRYNRSTDIWEEWDGSSWGEIPFAKFTASGNPFTILFNTSDGSDNHAMQFGGASDTRGAYLVLNGNETASPGIAQLKSGNVSGNYVALECASSGHVYLLSNSTTRWDMDGSTGDLLPYADDTYNIGSASKQLHNVFVPTKTWTPTYTVTGTGSPTITSTSTAKATYQRVGKRVHCDLSFTGTLGGSTVTEVRATLPSTAASSSRVITYFFDTSATRIGLGSVSGNQLIFYREDLSSSFVTGASREFAAQFEYDE